jgi:NTE family protein
MFPSQALMDGVRPFVALLVATAASATWAAEQLPASRPCAGTALVLSGGGARGGAHVGVIKVLEELRVPVSCVVGTSMGSIVGGLYASGLSPEQLESQLSAIDWDSAFDDKPDRSKMRFRTKQEDIYGLFPLEIGVGAAGISTARGIITGTRIEFILRSLTLHAATVEDFDRLRLPYRAVASDLATGEKVVLGRGDLASSMRASMSIPGAFSPVRIDGRTLIDGMVARNLPIDVARDLGATRIIAVDVGRSPVGDVDTLGTAGVVAQTMTLLTHQNVDAQRALLGDQDLLIAPELGGMSPTAFGRIVEASIAGEAAARAAAKSLARFAVEPAAFDAFLVRQRRAPEPLPSLAAVKVVVARADGSREESAALAGRLVTQPGATLDLAALEDDLVRVLQAGEFETVTFGLSEAGTGRRELRIDARHKSWGPGYLRFGLDMESNLEGNTSFSLLGSYRRPELTKHGGELRVHAALGTPSQLGVEFFQPLAQKDTWFVAPRMGYERRIQEFVTPAGDEVLRFDESDLGIDLGHQFSNVGEVRLGVYGGDSHMSSETTSPVPELRLQRGGWRLSAVRDQIDDLHFPTSGAYSWLTFEDSDASLGAELEFQKLQLSSTQAFTRGRNTFLTSVTYGTTPSGILPPTEDFLLGGFRNLSGYTKDSLRGDEMLLIRVADHWRLSEFGQLGRGFLGLTFEAGNVWWEKGSVDLGDLKCSLMALFGIDNRVTPIFLGFAVNDEGGTQGHLQIGHSF